MSYGNRLYDIFMAPLERGAIRAPRREFIPSAEGRVLELGAGTGANCAFYDHRRIERLLLSDTEISPLLARRAEACGAQTAAANVMTLPWPDAAFDTVVFTLLFCSVEEPATGLAEIARVLVPGGRIIFIEHVIGCSALTRTVQRGLTPLWRRVAGNCHLDRDTTASLERAGFSIERSSRRSGCVLTGGVARR